MRLPLRACAVLVAQFRHAVTPFDVDGAVRIVQLGHARILMMANATYSWGVPAYCMTTRPWGGAGTTTLNLYYRHDDVNCWVRAM